MVEIWNDRGRMRIPAHITEHILRGVIAVAQGAWYTPDEDGADLRGSVNILTISRPTPLAKGNPQHSNLVDIRRV
jgi:anaerobic dimethyl sulfoxide reductase subunit A